MRVWAWLLGVALFCGCGDDNRRPRYDSDFDDTTTLGSLDDDDRQRLCESQRVFVEAHLGLEPLMRAVCLPIVITRDISPSACQVAMDACMAPARLSDFRASVLLPCDDGLAPSCEDVRVQDIEACVNVQFGAHWRIRDVSCDPREAPYVLEETEAAMQDPACLRVMRECPGAIQTPLL